MEYRAIKNRVEPITVADLENAWAEIDNKILVPKIPENSRTLLQLMDKWGLKETQARLRVRELVKSGRLKRIMVLVDRHLVPYYVPSKRE